MDLNTFVFPAPNLGWFPSMFFGELLWIPVAKEGIDPEFFATKIKERGEKVGFGSYFRANSQEPA